VLQAGAERPSYDELAALVVEQARTIAELRAENDRLRVRVAELERRLGRNSGNSSLPPSADTFTRPDKPPTAKSGRRRGGQADVTGAASSTGWVSGVLAEAADLVGDCLKLIRALLVLGHVLHADETTTRIGALRLPPIRSRHQGVARRTLLPRLRPQARAERLPRLPPRLHRQPLDATHRTTRLTSQAHAASQSC
jgi:hypothetical protein